MAAIYLKETLPPRETKPASDANSEDTVNDADKEETSYKSLFTPHINALMFSFAILSLLGGAQSALQPLFCFTPVNDGGLGFSESEIGTAMSIRAVATIACQVIAFPWLQRTWGTQRLYKWLMVLWIPTYIGLPFLNILARQGYNTGVWVGLSFTLACSAVANMAFGKFQHRLWLISVCNLLMVNAAAPSRQLLGAINGT
jgi:Na+/melibiose symporter-like transporter